MTSEELAREIEHDTESVWDDEDRAHVTNLLNEWVKDLRNGTAVPRCNHDFDPKTGLCEKCGV